MEQECKYEREQMEQVSMQGNPVKSKGESFKAIRGFVFVKSYPQDRIPAGLYASDQGCVWPTYQHGLLW